MLHSNEIRTKSGIYKTFLNETIYTEFKNDILKTIKESGLKIISSSIDKRKLLTRKKDYEKEGINYDIGDLYLKNLEWISERILHLIKNNSAKLIFEIQGKKEAREIKAFTKDLASNGNFYVKKEVFNKLDLIPLFFLKKDNVAGIQISDYCAYPFAKHLKDKDSLENNLFNLLREFIYKGDYGEYGLKEWP